MSKDKNKKQLTIQGLNIAVTKHRGEDYISLTDMIRAKDGDFFVSDWLRNRNTLEFLGIWESIYNPNFNYGEFAIIKNQSGLNSYKISAKDWIKKTNSIGLISSAGRYGETTAHKDIAFEFGMWISAEFKIYLIKEFQRLKDEENNRLKLDWNLQRAISKINYRIHTDAIKEKLIPPILSKIQINFIYANEADLLNMALFGQTAADWKNKNQDKKGNLRDYASIEQLIVLSNLESINAMLINQGINSKQRLEQLNIIAIQQIGSLLKNPDIVKYSLKNRSN